MGNSINYNRVGQFGVPCTRDDWFLSAGHHIFTGIYHFYLQSALSGGHRSCVGDHRRAASL